MPARGDVVPAVRAASRPPLRNRCPATQLHPRPRRAARRRWLPRPPPATARHAGRPPPPPGARPCPPARRPSLSSRWAQSGVAHRLDRPARPPAAPRNEPAVGKSAAARWPARCRSRPWSPRPGLAHGGGVEAGRVPAAPDVDADADGGGAGRRPRGGQLDRRRRVGTRPSTVEKPSGLPQAVSERRAAAGSGAPEAAGGPPASPRGQSWVLTTASSSPPPSASYSAGRSTAPGRPRPGRRGCPWALTVVGSASRRTRAGGPRRRPAPRPPAITGQPRGGECLHPGAGDVDVGGAGEQRLVAVEPGQARSGRRPCPAGPCAPGRWPADQCGLRSNMMPVFGRRRRRVGPAGHRVVAVLAPVSAAAGTGLPAGRAST